MSATPSGMSKAARIRASILGLAALSFVAGGAVTFLVMPKLRSAMAGVEEAPLAERLALDASQEATLAKILAEGEAKLAAIRDEVQAAYGPRLEAVASETDREIDARLELTDEQRKRLEAWRSGRAR